MAWRKNLCGTLELFSGKQGLTWDPNNLATEQRDLLAKDRDIRELIGARDLYITEIYDVARNGDTRKAAGRVFYT